MHFFNPKAYQVFVFALHFIRVLRGLRLFVQEENGSEV